MNRSASVLFVRVAFLSTLSALPAPPVSATGAEAPSATVRIVISFYSIASGPVADDQKAMDSLIATYETEHEVRLQKRVSPYGMEGDFAYCLSLTELSTNDQEDFVARVRAQAKTLEQVHVEENAPCPGRS